MSGSTSRGVCPRTTALDGSHTRCRCTPIPAEGDSLVGAPNGGVPPRPRHRRPRPRRPRPSRRAATNTVKWSARLDPRIGPVRRFLSQLADVSTRVGDKDGQSPRHVFTSERTTDDRDRRATSRTRPGASSPRAARRGLVDDGQPRRLIRGEHRSAELRSAGWKAASSSNRTSRSTSPASSRSRATN